MKNKGFDYTSRDSQGTAVEPISIKEFDIERYHKKDLPSTMSTTSN